MVDVTLEIILTPSAHDLSYKPTKDAQRFRRGDIFDVHRSTDIATLTNGVYRITEGIGSKVFGYIHVRGVPRARARKMQAVLTQDTGETTTRSVIDPLTKLAANIVEPDEHRRRAWRIPASVIPLSARKRLLVDREITVDWTAFRDKIRRKLVSARLDPATDDESQAVKDADLA